MDHDEAIRLMVAEKYLLDELSPELREQFEDHLFGCTECALDVRAGASFIDHTKVVLSNPDLPQPVAEVVKARPRAWAGWLRPAFALTALVALVAILAYQNFVTYPALRHEIAELTPPRLLASVSLISSSSRGGVAIPSVVTHLDAPFLLFVDIASQERFSSYVGELYSPAQTLVFSIPISKEQAKQTLTLEVPAVQKEPGDYTLVVRGLTDTGAAATQKPEIARYQFELRPDKSQ